MITLVLWTCPCELEPNVSCESSKFSSSVLTYGRSVSSPLPQLLTIRMHSLMLLTWPYESALLNGNAYNVEQISSWKENLDEHNCSRIKRNDFLLLLYVSVVLKFGFSSTSFIVKISINSLKDSAMGTLWGTWGNSSLIFWWELLPTKFASSWSSFSFLLMSTL